MGQASPIDIESLLGGAMPVRVAPPIDAGAVHCDGMVELARLIPRVSAQRREKPRRSILVDRARA